MDVNFWLKKWETKEIAFHEPEANPLLVRFFPQLNLPVGSRVFVPLCGKTLDIHWLLSKGFRVAGAELIELAVRELFAELKVRPVVTAAGALTHYAAPGIDIFVGNIFELSAERLGAADAVYDRAAMVALPKDARGPYTRHIRTVTRAAPQLLVSYEYDQAKLNGPPFAVSNAEVRHHYEAHYDLELLFHAEVPGGLKGQCPAIENVWALRNGH